MQMERKQTLRVMVASGRKLQCIGVCQDVVIFLGEQSFCVDFFVIPLGGFGAILGVNWLQILVSSSGISQKCVCDSAIRDKTFSYKGQRRILATYLSTNYQYTYMMRGTNSCTPYWENLRRYSMSPLDYHLPGISTIESP